MPPKILVLCGPTATGKTALAVELALALGGEVVSADSMQLYRHMDIGTAKPTAAEMRGVPHHMLDVAEPEEDWSVARYVPAAAACVDEILRRGRLPIVAGGTGLYIDSLVSGRDFAAGSSGGVHRARLERRAAEEGLEPLREELRRVDPAAAARLHPNDKRRILRALEVWYETGRTITEHDADTRRLPPRYDAVRVGLTFADRADLYARIDARVDAMMAAGLAEEVRSLLARGVSPGCTAMQAIGYKELSAALPGGGDLAAAVAGIKLRSRQYAKRQLTWFRRTEGIGWICWEKSPDLARGLQFSTGYLNSHGV